MKLLRVILRVTSVCCLVFSISLLSGLEHGSSDYINSAASPYSLKYWTMGLPSVAEARDSHRERRRKHDDEDRDERDDRDDGDDDDDDDDDDDVRSPRARLRVKNLTRDKHELNWIRLNARKSRGHGNRIAHYEYFVVDAQTGIHVPNPGGSTKAVAHVLLSPGKYFISVVVTNAAGKQSMRSVKASLPGKPHPGFDGTPIQWAMGRKWEPGDASISISLAAGPLTVSDIQGFFAPRLASPVLGATSSSGCGSMMNNAGNSISVATGMLSMIPGAGPLLGPVNAASAGLKLAGCSKSSACTQAKFDAINDQLKYQESQIQDIYTTIYRDEAVFFDTLAELNNEIQQAGTLTYNATRDQVTTTFNRFMLDAGLWNNITGPAQAITEAQVNNYLNADGTESPGLARCKKGETRCCYLPYRDDLFGPNDPETFCPAQADEGGPFAVLQGFATSTGLSGSNLASLLGSNYQDDPNDSNCTHNCYTRIQSSLTDTALGLLFDIYADHLDQQVDFCASRDATARASCSTPDNNLVSLYESYNTAVLAIYQQSLYSLQQAYSMEYLVNQFNYFSDSNGTGVISPLIVTEDQKIPGTYYTKDLPLALACNGDADTTDLELYEGQSYNCAQQQLTMAYVQRVNILYQNVLGYIVTDRPTTRQHWPDPSTIVLDVDGTGPIGPITLNPAIDYDAVVGARLNTATRSLEKTPIEHVERITGIQSDSPNLYNWTTDGVLYQFSIQDPARCFHTLNTYYANNSVNIADPIRDGYLEDVFADPADCPSVFALPDGSPPNQGFYDGKTLQPYDQFYVSPGGGTCEAACYTCASGQDPNNTDPAPDPPIEWAEGGHGLQVLYETPAPDWASASSTDNGSWKLSCINASFSGTAGNGPIPPTLCAKCLDGGFNNPVDGPSYGERNCKICPGGRWGNDHGTLFCEGHTTELCRGYCSGDNFCGDSRYALGPDGDSDYTDCAKCGGDPVLALSARMPGNVRFCSQSADTAGQSPYAALLGPGVQLDESASNYDEAGNQMRWFELPASYSGNQAGLRPGTVHLTCGNWVMPPTVDEWLTAQNNGTHLIITIPADDDTRFVQQNRSGHKAIASIAWDEGNANAPCHDGFTKIHGPFCAWDQDYASGVDSVSATDVWKTCGKLNWQATILDKETYAGFTTSFTNPATGLEGSLPVLEGGLPVRLGLVKQCYAFRISGTNVVAPFALYEYAPDTDTTTTNSVSDYGYVCTPTYIDYSLIGEIAQDNDDFGNFGDIEQTLTCSLLDGSEYRVGIRRAVVTSTSTKDGRGETFVTMKQSNIGCPEACYHCNSGLGGNTAGGLDLVMGSDDVEVCDGYCSGYNFCGGKEYNQPSVDFAPVDCTRCGAGDDDGDPQLDRICAASESDWCVSEPGTDVYYGKKYVNSLSPGNVAPGSGKVTTLDQMVNDGTATKVSGAPGLIQCSNDYFPRDPAVGFFKHCITRPSPSGARLCASTEGDYCDCDGDVYYGKKFVSSLVSEGGHAPGGGPLTTYSQVVSESTTYKLASDVEDGIECSYTAMGGAPAPDFYKHCYCVPD